MSKSTKFLVFRLVTLLVLVVLGARVSEAAWSTPPITCDLVCFKHAHSVVFFVISTLLVCGFMYRGITILKKHRNKQFFMSDQKSFVAVVLFGATLLFLFIASHSVEDKHFVYQMKDWECKTLFMYVIICTVGVMILDTLFKITSIGKES